MWVALMRFGLKGLGWMGRMDNVMRYTLYAILDTRYVVRI